MFVDCDLVTRNIELGRVAARIGPRTRAIMPTHWPGSLVDMDALYALARHHKLRVIEDAALVIGSRWQGRPVGAIGDLVTFSFHPNKNITSIEGGALVCNDARRGAARRGAALPRHRAAAGRHARRRVSRRQVQPARRQRADRRSRSSRGCRRSSRTRRELVDRYFERFATDPPACCRRGRARDDGQSWNMFSVLLPLDGMTMTRTAFRDALARARHRTGISYEALHLSTLGRRFGYHRGDLPNTERIADATVTLPLHAAMTVDDVDRVCAACADVIGASARQPAAH